MEKLTENVIHVTGFDVFRGFTKANPSWDAVSQLPDFVDFNGKRFSIVKHRVPVTYSAVDDKIKEIWINQPMVC